MKKITSSKLITLLSTFLFTSACVENFAQEPNTNYPVPSERQLEWHDMEMYAFLCMAINTYSGKEWGYGNESPELFNPTDFDADKIVRQMKEAGFKGVLLTCKHHDGFCLWPTKTTDYNITKSPWKQGKGDIVQEVADACRKHNMKLGLYLSPWDRNSEHYAKPEYVEIFHNQLRELLTQYGELFLVWFDGANGGDGYYGGANESRTIDKHNYYQWEKVNNMIRELQPKANIFSDIGPDVRWIGNESGFAHYPHWSTYTPQGNEGRPPAPGDTKYTEALAGHVNGKYWIPAEADVSIRPGWFCHDREDAHVRTPENILNLYLASVGRGANLNLNIPPDQNGLFHPNDENALKGFKTLLDELYKTNYAGKAKVTASSESEDHQAIHVLDRKRETYWQGKAQASPNQEETITLTLPKKETFSVIRLAEPIQLGQHIRKFKVETKINGEFIPWISGESVGARVILTGKEISTDELKITIQESTQAPALSEVSIWKMPVILTKPTLSSDKNNTITLKGGLGSTVHYTTDGTVPTLSSQEYIEPFVLKKGGILKAASFHEGKASTVLSEIIPACKSNWKVLKAESRATDPALLIDGNTHTLWHTHTAEGPLPTPQEIIIDMGESQEVGSFLYVPRSDCQSGTIDLYELYLSNDGKNWGKPVLDGEFSNIKNNPLPQNIPLEKPQKARYFKFIAKRSIDGNCVSIMELGILPPISTPKD